MWIEIFKTGLHTDSNGQTQEFTAEDLDKIVQTYNTQIKEDASNAAPVVKGHPESNTPSYGWVAQLARRGTTLLANLKDLSQDLVEDIRQKRFQKVSISLYPNLMLRHIGMLGAATPAVKGLKPIEFTDDFSEFPDENEIDNISEFQSELQTLKNENSILKTKLIEYEEQIATANFKEFSEKIFQKGKLPSNLKPQLIDLLSAIHYIDNQGNLTKKLIDFIEKITTIAPLGEFARRDNAVAYNFQEKFGGKMINPERKEMDEEIQKLISTNPNLSYEEAFNYIINN
ncbi:MAG TPA: hypothetical protein PKV40_06095 [Candidatus Kapabacteria bacterium]|nr:hypothetical protein [Candidatus Kapabacteria bacterium]